MKYPFEDKLVRANSPENLARHQQKLARLKLMIAAEVVKQAFAARNMSEDVVMINAADGDQVSHDRGRVCFFNESGKKLIGQVIDTDDPDVVRIVINNVLDFVRHTRAYTFDPTEHGFDYDDPFLDVEWPTEEIREGLKDIAEFEQPKIKRMQPRPVKILGGFEK